MSWIFGIAGAEISSDLISKIRRFTAEPLYIYQSKNVYILGGGLKETCLSSLLTDKKETKDKGWIVCGIGISPELDERKHILTCNDWEIIFRQPDPRLEILEGHFAAITWDQDKIFGYVDSRGIRDLHLTIFDKYILISTRIDWFAKFGLKCSINFVRFGSRWLAFNQLSRKSIVKPIERLGPGGTAEIKDNCYSVRYPDYPYLPQTNKSLEEIIFSLTTFPQNAGYKIITCLSGGIDSRLLLASLLSLPKDQWQVCVFGSADHPDAQIARNIVSDFNLNHIYFDNQIPDETQMIRSMRDYVVHTQCIGPATEAIRLGFYGQLHQPKNIVIDGAFGEIMRRSYFNRLLIRGKAAFFSGQPDKIAQYLKIQRADIFNDDVLRLMEDGLVEDVANVWQKFLKSEQANEPENFLDLLAILTRLPNLFGPEVSRLDHLLLNYMPFAQPSFLATVLNTNLNLRKNGHFSKSFIEKRRHVLTRYLLVKDSYAYPYGLSNIIINRAWREIAFLLGLCFRDDSNLQIMKILETFIRDTVLSKETRSFVAYDIKKIDDLVDRFYAGEHHLAEELAWWLSFELWRQECLFT